MLSYIRTRSQNSKLISVWMIHLARFTSKPELTSPETSIFNSIKSKTKQILGVSKNNLLQVRSKNSHTYTRMYHTICIQERTRRKMILRSTCVPGKLAPLRFVGFSDLPRARHSDHGQDSMVVMIGKNFTRDPYLKNGTDVIIHNTVRLPLVKVVCRKP